MYYCSVVYARFACHTHTRYRCSQSFRPASGAKTSGKRVVERAPRTNWLARRSTTMETVCVCVRWTSRSILHIECVVSFCFLFARDMLDVVCIYLFNGDCVCDGQQQPESASDRVVLTGHLSALSEAKKRPRWCEEWLIRSYGNSPAQCALNDHGPMRWATGLFAHEHTLQRSAH